MDLPSGDQEGSRSAVPGVLVRLRISPFSPGRVKMSPCASATTRTPVGESATFCTSFAGISVSLRSQRGQVSVDRDRHGVLLVRGQIIEVQRPELLVDQRPRTCAYRLQIVAVILHHLLHFLRV